MGQKRYLILLRKINKPTNEPRSKRPLRANIALPESRSAIYSRNQLYSLPPLCK